MRLNLPGRTHFECKEYLPTVLTGPLTVIPPGPSAIKFSVPNDLTFRRIYFYLGFSGAQSYELQGELIASLQNEPKLRIPVNSWGNTAIGSGIPQTFVSLVNASASPFANNTIAIYPSPQSTLAWPTSVNLPPFEYNGNIDEIRFDFNSGKVNLLNGDLEGIRAWLGVYSCDTQ